MDKPPTKAKHSAERAKPPEELDADLQHALQRAAETCQQRFDEKPTRYAYHLAAILEALEHDPRLIDPVYKKVQAIQASRAAASGAAVVTAIGGVPVRRVAMTKDPQTGEDVPVEDENGLLVWQRVRGRKWEGASMVNVTRWAIAVYDADPLDVAAAVIDKLPPLLKVDCRKFAEMDAERVGKAIEPLLDENLRSAMTANREDSRDANPGYGQIVEHAERIDRANEDLLDQPECEQIPAKVFRAILEALGHPKPGNLTRD